MNKQISVIGCGWLGLPLAAEFVKNGHLVKGSTTSDDKLAFLRKEGILPHVVSISENAVEGAITACLKDSEILIINIPPGLRKNPQSNFIKKMELLCESIEKSTVSKVLFISSTSIYKDGVEMPVITEENSINDESYSAKQLIGAETVFKSNPNFETTILRFSGLIGANRDPAKFLSGKKNLKDPDGPINLIHQEDCINIIKRIIKNNFWNTDFNAAAPQHPAREVYYSAVCTMKDIPLPHFDHTRPSQGKVISNKKVEQMLNYRFLHDL